MKKASTIGLLTIRELAVHAMYLTLALLTVECLEPGINTQLGYTGHAPRNERYSCHRRT